MAIICNNSQQSSIILLQVGVITSYTNPKHELGKYFLTNFNIYNLHSVTVVMDKYEFFWNWGYFGWRLTFQLKKLLKEIIQKLRKLLHFSQLRLGAILNSLYCSKIKWGVLDRKSDRIIKSLTWKIYTWHGTFTILLNLNIRDRACF